MSNKSAISTRGSGARGNKDPEVGTGGDASANSPSKKVKGKKASTPETPVKDALEETPGMKAAEDLGGRDPLADETEETSKPTSNETE